MRSFSCFSAEIHKTENKIKGGKFSHFQSEVFIVSVDLAKRCSGSSFVILVHYLHTRTINTPRLLSVWLNLEKPRPAVVARAVCQQQSNGRCMSTDARMNKMWTIKEVLFNHIKEWSSNIWCNTIALENLMLVIHKKKSVWFHIHEISQIGNS